MFWPRHVVPPNCWFIWEEEFICCCRDYVFGHCQPVSESYQEMQMCTFYMFYGSWNSKPIQKIWKSYTILVNRLKILRSISQNTTKQTRRQIENQQHTWCHCSVCDYGGKGGIKNQCGYFDTVFWLHELELRLGYYGAVSYAPWWQEAGNHGA